MYNQIAPIDTSDADTGLRRTRGMSARAGESSNWRILIVDDDPLALFMTASIASMAIPGVHVESIEDPLHAIALCSRLRFDCILVDYEMPGLNGIEFAQAVRAGDPHVPILMCSAAGNEMVVADAMKMGINDYLPKTCMTARALGEAVGEAIEAARSARLLEAQHRDIETFAFALVHEVRQPARQIATLADMLRWEADPAAGTRVDRLLDFVGAASGRLNDLIDVLTNYALLAETPALEPLDSAKCIRAAIGRIMAGQGKGQAGAYPVTLVSSGGDAVLGHPEMLDMAVSNLVLNGLKYNQSEQPRVWIEIGRHDTLVEIRVTDNGIGIPLEQREAIFRPLVRLHPRARYGGTGLGLAVVHKAASAMNGTVRCLSGPDGVGTTFVLTLQAAPGEDMPIPVPKAFPRQEGDPDARS